MHLIKDVTWGLLARTDVFNGTISGVLQQDHRISMDQEAGAYC